MDKCYANKNAASRTIIVMIMTISKQVSLTCYRYQRAGVYAFTRIVPDGTEKLVLGLKPLQFYPKLE